jgi:hypothetical protein
MKPVTVKMKCAGTCVLAGLLAIAPAMVGQAAGFADVIAGQGSQRDSTLQSGRTYRIFGERHRAILADYYSDVFRSGNCPSGLDKKRSACVAPAQARTWAIGRHLPPDVIYYDVPRLLAVRFGELPNGYGYVRVARDILVISLGARVVVDALRDFERM